MNETFICKLNLGCGISGVKGWHNFDNSPTILLSRIPILGRWKRITQWPADVRRVDVIKGLPFDQGEVDCIYSSHMIEHLKFSEAVQVVRHCYRALRAGGVLRLAVPDLRIIVNSYLADGTAPYLVERLNLCSDASDLIHKGAHHRAMYDARYLATLFHQSGFTNPEQKQFAQSRIPEIESVELESRRHETLYMEAAKI